MFKQALAFAVAAACLTAGAAQAQSYDNRSDQRAQHSDRSGYAGQRVDRGSRYDGRRDDRDSRYDGRRDNRYEARQDSRYDSRDYRYRNNSYNNGYNNGQRYHMRRGERLAAQYGHRQYVVNDWRGHRGLYAPQRGHHWVQVGSDYALVAIATGLIAHVLMN